LLLIKQSFPRAVSKLLFNLYLVYSDKSFWFTLQAGSQKLLLTTKESGPPCIILTMHSEIVMDFTAW